MKFATFFVRIGPMSVLAATSFFLVPVALRADSATDRKIEDAAQTSYNFRAVLENSVSVKADEGVVTLSGKVRDREQKTLAEHTVRNLPGVVGVDNQLELSAPSPDRADGWIALKIKSLLLVRPNVSARRTEVTVRDGVVTLAGETASPAQRELTVACAREVEGVKSVVNRLQVTTDQ